MPANLIISPIMRQSDIYARVGKNLAARRKALNKTQSFVAGRAGISRPSLANIETGNQTISLHQLYNLAAVLELSDARELLPAGIGAVDENASDDRKLKIETTSRLNPDHISEVQGVVAAWKGKK